jgi:hypothetical protein
VIPITAAAETARRSLTFGTDYAEAIPEIVTVMVRDLGLPRLQGVVTLYPNRFSFESALAADALTDLDQVEKQFGSKARAEVEQNIPAISAQLAVSFAAVGRYRRVLVNEGLFHRNNWTDNVRLLAHELTHTAQRELVNGQIMSADTWLLEGFAEWVAYKVLDTLGMYSFAKSREDEIDKVAKAMYVQTFPSLSQIALGRDWSTWNRTLGNPATYKQAFLAVDFLVEQKGLSNIVGYFQKFAKSNDRQRNFTAAFGEPLATFEGQFTAHLQGLTRSPKR